MNRSGLHVIIVARVVVTGVVGYLYYQDRQHTAGVDISVGKSGISIETK